MTRILQVSLNNYPVGQLTQLTNGSIVFAFNENYLHDPNRPVLSQSFFNPSGKLIAESQPAKSILPAFFSNLLPEGILRNYLAQRANIKPSQEFKLIELLGEDLPGAVIIKPLESGLDIHHEHEGKYENDQNLLRFSLAGVQLKFSAIAKWPQGLSIPTHGIGGDWIIKLPSQNYAHVPENEFAMLHLASEIGIPVPEIQLVSLKQINGLPQIGMLTESKALAVKRFDRKPNSQRVHIEDFAQVYNIYPDKKYEGVSFANTARMIWTLTGEIGLTDFIRRLTFTILIGNGDMHLKNWSFIYADGHLPALTPAYDLVSTIPYIPSDGLALTLGDTKNMQSITLEHFKKLVKKAEVPEYLVLQTVRDTVSATFTTWNLLHKNYELPLDIIERIQKHMNSLALRKY